MVLLKTNLCFNYSFQGKAALDIYTHDMQTPLLMAVAKDHMRIVDLLISNGADINIVDKDGDTSLHLALMRHAALNNPLMQLLTRVFILAAILNF